MSPPLKGRSSLSMRLREFENILRHRRIPYPKRSVELIALIAISCTFFLFMHTKNLNTRLKEMEVRLQPSEFSALGLTGDHVEDAKNHEDTNTLHGTYQYLKSTGQMDSTTAAALNNTKKAEIDIVFFNRVPKVGSQVLMELMNRLSAQNGYTTHRDRPSPIETIVIGHADEINLADEITDLKEPATYAKHVAYVNFTSIDYPRPIYVNLVRDPIERLISWFYYIRAPWYFIERKNRFPELPLPEVKWLQKSFDACVLSGDPECVFEPGHLRGLGDHRRQMLFFCGHERKLCMPFNSHQAMQKAKIVVERDYAVVGSWEDTNITLAVLEKYIPKFFQGATNLYYRDKQQLNKINRNLSRPTISHEVRNILSRNLTNEIEFYQFCKQRLYKQYIALKLRED